jgi:hypothetical protein
MVLGIDNFYTYKRNGDIRLYSECKPCSRNAQKMRRDNNLYHRKKKCRQLGITVEDFDKTLSNQGGVCKLCFKEDIVVGKNKHANRTVLAMDHNHKTGKFRGLLCFRCNVTVGVIEKEIENERLDKIIAYIS